MSNLLIVTGLFQVGRDPDHPIHRGMPGNFAYAREGGGRAYSYAVTPGAVRDAASVLATELVLCAQGVACCLTVVVRKHTTD